MAVISLLSSVGYRGKREPPLKRSSGKTDSSSRRWSMGGPSLSSQWREKKQEDQPDVSWCEHHPTHLLCLCSGFLSFVKNNSPMSS